MQFSLENEILAIQVNQKGAELSSVVRKSDQTEYIWQADPEIWGRHAPVLFPIVGRLKDDQYQYNGQTYNMKQHGFARNMDFRLVEDDDQSLHFLLSADDSTKAMYPFDFELHIRYSLDTNGLTVAYEINNPDERTLPFSIGAHPGFTCPFVEGEEYEDYIIRFEKKANAERHLLDGGLYNGQTEVVLEKADSLPLTKTLFDRDALVFQELESRYVELVSMKSDRQVRVTTEGFPYLGIWAKPAAPFVCIEPWQGLADYTDASGDITEKQGIHLLLPGQSHKAAYEMIFD